MAHANESAASQEPKMVYRFGDPSGNGGWCSGSIWGGALGKFSRATDLQFIDVAVFYLFVDLAPSKSRGVQRFHEPHMPAAGSIGSSTFGTPVSPSDLWLSWQ